MSIQHRILPDSELHEPKGAASAIQGTVYVSDGSGSGDWIKIPATSLQGISSAGVADRYIVTDGAGGLKTAPGNAFGQIYYNAGATIQHSAVSYTNSVMNNVAQNGTHLQVLVSGIYHITFSADVYDPDTGVPGYPHTVSLTLDGTNPVGMRSLGGSPHIWCEAIVPMIANGEVWIIGPDFRTRTGSLTAVYMG